MKGKKKHLKIRNIVWGLCSFIFITALIYMHFGGFSTGKTANPEEFAKFAQPVENIEIPENTRIIALGEATHGNAEFQQLKLDVFKIMVEEYHVKAFAIEGDFGGCEQVNRYIHGGDGTAKEAAAAIGFAIYRTDVMADLISYMRQYNESAAENEDIRFYGYDMQRMGYNFQFLEESCRKLGVDTTVLNGLMEGENWSSDCDYNTRFEKLTQVKDELINISDTNPKAYEDLAVHNHSEEKEKAIHFVDTLLQNIEVHNIPNEAGSDLRDQYMAKNVEWILHQEQQKGHDKIFVSGHNQHVAKWESLDSMGTILSNKEDNGYYVIGTDFYKTCCNMPLLSSKMRTNQVFYSHDPLAKASKLAGFRISWLDFTKVPDNTELASQISQYTYMGSLGEGYSVLMRLLPPSYRTYQQPNGLYDSMIYVTSAKPIKILQNK